LLVAFIRELGSGARFGLICEKERKTRKYTHEFS